jgi:hypothetical protein
MLPTNVREEICALASVKDILSEIELAEGMELIVYKALTFADETPMYMKFEGMM